MQRTGTGGGSFRAGLLMLLFSSTLGMSAHAQQPPPERPADEPPPVRVPAQRPPARPELEPSAPSPAPTPLAPSAPDATDLSTPPAQPAGLALTPPIETVPVGPPMPELLRESDFDLAACKLELTMLGARYRDSAPVTDPDDRDCGIQRPLHLTEILPGITLDGGAEMRCDTARALAHWTRDFVLPAASRLPGAPRLSGMMLGTTYDCRPVIGTESTARQSEHAFGNAIDIAGFRFADAEPLQIAPRQDHGDLPAVFQAAVQATACVEFTTVLGPGSNAAHDDHLHLDIKQRNGGYRLCQ
ncbi:extensin family protein [uncultured Paracoccus sp.]|uniref:extensin family protein n=1 Tax=uncultured Paracoccus sp. TaxID=189685 RepID=UPI0026372C2E|nr:extensin family protein [uncultured Paracoccus sp.]